MFPASMGRSQVVKAPGFDPGIVGSNPSAPAIFSHISPLPRPTAPNRVVGEKGAFYHQVLRSVLRIVIPPITMTAAPTITQMSGS